MYTEFYMKPSLIGDGYRKQILYKRGFELNLQAGIKQHILD